MSLQVWLPLNGDLRNQGLSNITVTNIGATVNTTGKIGKCYSFNGSNQYLSMPAIFSNNNQNLSFSCWIKINSLPSTYYCLLCSRTSSTSTGIAIYLKSDKTFYIDIGTRWITSVQDININTWYHITITSSNTGRKLYINGIETDSTTTSTAPTAVNMNYTLIGAQQNSASGTAASGTYLNGYLNDVRIYNHCLSAKEIEEIAKGLVLHYKLTGPTNISTTIPENLLIGSGFPQTEYEKMVANNNTTDWTGHVRWYNGNQGQHSFEDGIDTIILNTNKANLGPCLIRNTSGINLVANTSYTLSCEAKTSRPISTESDYRITFRIGYYTNNAWTWNFYESGNSLHFNATDTWQTFSRTFTINSTVANAQYICCAFTMYGHSNDTTTFSIRHCKLEKGTTATQWILNSEDDGYAAQIQQINSDNYTTEYDCSGYGHNGIVEYTENKKAYQVINDAPKYSNSVLLPNDNWVRTLDIPTTICPKDAITVSIWAKITSTWYNSSGAIISCAEGQGWALNRGSSGNIYFSIYAGGDWRNVGSTTSMSSILNGWHMFTATADSSTLNLYVDGELSGTAENPATSGFAFKNNYIFVGAEARSATESPNSQINGAFSDFRIYATALTADQVKELYNTSATIDKKGNIYARELIENTGNINITKTGQLQSNEIIDDDTIVTASFKKSDKSINGNTIYEY